MSILHLIFHIDPHLSSFRRIILVQTKNTSKGDFCIQENMFYDENIKESREQEPQGDVAINNQKIQNWTIIDRKDGEEEILKHSVSVYLVFGKKE